MNLPRRFLGTVAGAALFAVGSTALASETVALYQAYWAGLPAGDIKLVLQDDPGGYRDEIAIRSEGLAWLFTKFRGTAVAEGRFADGPPAPEHYEAQGARQTPDDAIYQPSRGGVRRSRAGRHEPEAAARRQVPQERARSAERAHRNSP
jgi:hypothetical protein